MKRTKIIATLGPATHTKEIITDLINNGLNAVRLNFSHGSYDDHTALIAMVRAAAAEQKVHIPIIQDLQGPKIRLGVLPENGVEVADGEEIVFDTSKSDYADKIFPVDFKELHESVKSGDRILLNDGRVVAKATQIEGTKISAKVEHGGLLSSHKGLNVPDSHISSSSLTDKDRADAVFGLSQGVDYIALSFVREPKDVLELRDLITKHEGKVEFPTRIIAKMERPEAIQNATKIIDVVDVIMVARGDLGIEIAESKVPVVQKQLIEAALAAGKPVIVATQMLDSMQDSPLPTRAEVSDVANAEIDLADAVMLSNESATGKFPRETVAMMASILTETEQSVYDDRLPAPPDHNSDSLALEVRHTVEEINAAVIYTATTDGAIAAHISHFRPQVPIVAVTPSDRLARQLGLYSGVYATVGSLSSAEAAIEAAHAFTLAKNLAPVGADAVVALGEPLSNTQVVSVLEVKAV